MKDRLNTVTETVLTYVDARVDEKIERAFGRDSFQESTRVDEVRDRIVELLAISPETGQPVETLRSMWQPHTQTNVDRMGSVDILSEAIEEIRDLEKQIQEGIEHREDQFAALTAELNTVKSRREQALNAATRMAEKYERAVGALTYLVEQVQHHFESDQITNLRASVQTALAMARETDYLFEEGSGNE